MARKIDYQAELTEGDRHYMAQRPWMVSEYEVQTGKRFDAPDTGFNDTSEPVDKQSSAYTERLEQELREKGAETSALREQVSSLEDQLDAAIKQLDSIRDAAVAAAQESDEDDEEDLPYEEWKYDDLSDEVRDRNAAYEESGTDKIQPASRKTEDLIAALEADDNRLEAEKAEGGDTEE